MERTEGESEREREREGESVRSSDHMIACFHTLHQYSGFIKISAIGPLWCSAPIASWSPVHSP
jgi:hypothetical protein